MRGAQNLCAGLNLLGMGRVAGCFAEFVAVPEERVYEIPDVVSDARAVFAEPVANMVHLFRIATPPHFCRLGIVGAGTMGSLALLMARRLGIREILVEDVDEAARQMGATLAVNPSTEDGRADARRFAGHGLDMVLDASGAADARQTAFELCRPGGEVVLLGMADVRSELDFGTSIRKEQRVTMSFGYTPVDFERSLRLLEDGEIDLTPWTAEMPLEDGQKAFDRMADSRDDTLKMILRVR
jgi:L-iditol 2-dehydrogenase